MRKQPNKDKWVRNFLTTNLLEQNPLLGPSEGISERFSRYQYESQLQWLDTTPICGKKYRFSDKTSEPCIKIHRGNKYCTNCPAGFTKIQMREYIERNTKEFCNLSDEIKLEVMKFIQEGG